MAYDPDKIFGEIRKLLANAPAGENPSRTAICQRLVDDGIVRSMGTAHKYVGAFFAAETIKAEIVAPDIDTSVLPAHVYTAFVALLDSAGRLKNEVGAALDDLAQRSSNAFAKMMAAHDLAQQAEIEELATELETLRVDRDNAHEQLLAEQVRGETLNAAKVEKDALLVEARCVESDLRSLVADQDARIAVQIEAAGSRDRLIRALESERDALQRQAERADNEIHQLRKMLGFSEGDLEAEYLAEPDHSQNAIQESPGDTVGIGRLSSDEKNHEDQDFELPSKSTDQHPQ